MLGHSWGGVVAMEYAIRHPDRVSQLLLLDTAPASAGDWRRLRRVVRRAPPGRGSRADGGDRGDRRVPAGRPRGGGRLLPDPLQDDAATTGSPRRARGATSCRTTPTKACSSRARSRSRLYEETSGSPQWDLFPALRELDVPTLVLHGEHDFVPVELAARIAEAVPGARLSVLPGCGHFTYLEAPDGLRRGRRLLRPLARGGRIPAAAGADMSGVRPRTCLLRALTWRQGAWFRAIRRQFGTRRGLTPDMSGRARRTSALRTRAASPSPRRARGRASPASSARSRGRARPGSGAAPARARRGRAGARRAPARRRRGP